ncbi:hypothetical protein [Nocardioides sp.]|uniref:FitA-like ribbon-helix-helix domain-containing protein n=1 Tax=Nocardioides sp. TaxID=35761 RepID=UPI0027178B95|nr:hypothetical protein [Nocardioides sp.]MDO9457255.1 hypothetical protein [Nocardioides sp.]
MPKVIQVRNVPDETHRALHERAASAGMSLSDYALQALVEYAARPPIADTLRRAAARRGRVDPATIAAVLDDARGQ